MSTNVSVLLVEDDPSTALLVGTVLRGQGYAVAGTAESGPQAMEMAVALRPDLVLMDIFLSGPMDGIEAAAGIRADPGCPIVFLTSHTDPEVLARARTVEPHGYLLKPLDPRALLPTIELALHKHRMERERQEMTEQLQSALAEVEQLRGLFPVCAWCRRVRDDGGYWDSIEGYLAKHLNTQYTHGICNECDERVRKEAGI